MIVPLPALKAEVPATLKMPDVCEMLPVVVVTDKEPLTVTSPALNVPLFVVRPVSATPPPTASPKVAAPLVLCTPSVCAPSTVDAKSIEPPVLISSVLAPSVTAPLYV